MSFTEADKNALVKAPSPHGPVAAYMDKKIGRVRATFDAADGKAIGTHGLNLFIPDNSIVKRAFYKVITTFTSATDAATIALKVEGANDLISAVAISAATDWDAAIPKICIPDDAIGNFIETTAKREVSAVVAVEALTAGKLHLWIEYETYDDVA